ncbi:hypothetical protein BC940DRAFT_351599 [Gongronella butleri]|nr:hypothetical protein BC940DRAFT_351599 [Gongronella butleri]
MQTLPLDEKTKRRVQPPRRFWSLQRLTGNPQWKKVGPMQLDKLKMAKHQMLAVVDKPSKQLALSPYSQAKQKAETQQQSKENALRDVIHVPSQSEHMDDAAIEARNDKKDEEEEEKKEEMQRLGLRRKAAHGLKRIITHFSLSEISAMSETTPGLSRSGKGAQAQAYTTMMMAPPAIPESSGESSSLATLSSTSDLHITQAPLLMNSTPIASNWTPSPLQLAPPSERSLPPLPPTASQDSSQLRFHAHGAYLEGDSHDADDDTDHDDFQIDSNAAARAAGTAAAFMHQASTHMHLRQAASWISKPFHRFLGPPMANAQQPHHLEHPQEHMAPVMAQDHDIAGRLSPTGLLLPRISHSSLYASIESSRQSPQMPWAEERTQANVRPFDFNFRFARRKILRCRVIQITNMSSSKEYQYELFVQLNDVTKICQTGSLKKISKGISAASPKESFSFEVDSPFSLTFTLCAKPIPAGLTKIKSLLSKMDLAAHHHHQGKDSPVADASSDASSSSSSDGGICEATLPVVGFTSLLSGNRFEAFTGKGLSRYTLTKPVVAATGANAGAAAAPDLDLELMVAFQLEDAISPCNTYMSGLGTGELDFDAALTACRDGDYLTFYVRTKHVPSWTRFWVSLDHGELYLRQLSYEHKDPVDSISLSQLESVRRPWEDLQDEIYFGRKHGIVLQFKKEHIDTTHVVLDDQEQIDGYMYLFADSPKKAALWRTVLSAYATADYVTPNPAINARYLWKVQSSVRPGSRDSHP